MRRAKRPLDRQATVRANAAVHDLTEPPGRPLDPTSPQDAALRRKWMDAYSAAGGAVEDVTANAPVGEVCKTCPHFIELVYLTCHQQPVAGAEWHVRSPAFSADGTLDQAGCARINGVPPITGFQYWFDHDPGTYVPRGPELATSGQPKEEAVSALDEIGAWIWGTVQGDFNKDQSTSQTVVNAVIGVIPIADQVLDIRDIISGCKDLIEFYCEDEAEQQAKPEVLGLSYEAWLWLSVFIIALGCIPSVGSVLKGVLKCLIRFLQNLGVGAAKLTPAQIKKLWEELVKILNYFGVKPGSAHRWLSEVPGKLSGWLDEAALKIRAAFDAVGKMIEAAADYARRFAGKKLPVVGELLSLETAQRVIARAQRYKAAIAKAYGRLDAMKQKILQWLEDLFRRVLGGKHHFEANGKIDTPAGNVRVQESAPPPEIDSAKALLRKQTIERTGKPSRVHTFRPEEVPYHRPPIYHVVEPGKPLDLSKLDPNKKYLWVVDPDGRIIVAPERQPGFGVTDAQPNGRVVKHGDLTPGPDGAYRGEARAGGELIATRGTDGKVEWIMNDDSSYAFARTDGHRSTQDNLNASRDLLGQSGTDISNVRIDE